MSDRHDVALPPEDQAEARAAKKLIAAVGGLEEAARETGKSTSALSRYCMPNCPDSMPNAVSRRLEQVTHGTAGHPLMTRFNAERLGYTLVRLPDNVACDSALTTVHTALSRMSKESGEAVATVVEGIADGETRPSELDAAISELTDMIEAAVQLRAILEHRRNCVRGEGE